MSTHANVSIFVPHYGCPQRCSFCNQNAITGKQNMPTAEDVRQAMEQAKQTNFGGAKKREIAFFGGSFTAIDRSKMLELLNAAYPYVQDGTVDGIRISTRPDFVDLEVLYILKTHGVTAIELGAQSMDDDVLTLNRRGHLAEHVVHAAEIIHAYQMELGLQMMTGLLGDTPQKAMQTAEKLAALHPATMRIYPLVILPNTYLSVLYQNGSFIPQTLTEAIELCSQLVLYFESQNIRVIRLGLHQLNEKDVIAGPWHPAFSELCESKIYLDILCKKLWNKPCREYLVYVGKGELSKAVGHNKSNVSAMQKLGYTLKIQEKEGIFPRQIEIV